MTAIMNEEDVDKSCLDELRKVRRVVFINIVLIIFYGSFYFIVFLNILKKYFYFIQFSYSSVYTIESRNLDMQTYFYC